MNTNEFVIQLVRDYPSLVLTGSRALGGAREDSDWDFFGNVIPTGFKVESVSDYKDNFINAVYRHSIWPVHVQVLASYEDVEWKCRAQELINGLPLGLKLAFQNASKSSKKHIWNWAKDQTKELVLG